MVVLYCSLILMSLLFGVSISKRFENREVFYEKFVAFLADYEANLLFRQDNLLDLINSEEKSDFNDFLKSIIKSNGDLKTSPEYLSFKESKQIQYIILNLSSAGFSSVEQSLQHAKTIANRKLEETTKQKKKYGSMSINLSILVGLLLVVLLI